MNILTELLKENSRYNVNRIVKMVSEEPTLFRDLIQLTLGGNTKIALRASWVVTHAYDSYPELVSPFVHELIGALPGFAHTGIRRNILRIFLSGPIPEKLQGKLYDDCTKWVISKKEPIAVKANAMEILVRFALEEPDLKNEVIPLIYDTMSHGSIGIKAKGKNVLHRLGIKDMDVFEL